MNKEEFEAQIKEFDLLIKEVRRTVQYAYPLEKKIIYLKELKKIQDEKTQFLLDNFNNKDLNYSIV